MSSVVFGRRRNGSPQGVPLWEDPAAYQLVGRVTAYQGDDG